MTSKLELQWDGSITRHLFEVKAESLDSDISRLSGRDCKIPFQSLEVHTRRRHSNIVLKLAFPD
jgi:hypothetical protein